MALSTSMHAVQLEPLGQGVFQCVCLDDEESREVLTRAKETIHWDSALVRQGYTGVDHARDDLRRAMEVREEQHPEVFEPFKERLRTLAASIATQVTHDPLELSPVRFVRYSEGGFFKVHSDTSGTDRRRFAIVIYLNDDFEGGATVFPLLGSRSVPKQGMGVVFPANRLHRGDVVTRGSKYILVMWLLDRSEGAGT